MQTTLSFKNFSITCFAEKCSQSEIKTVAIACEN